MTARKRDIGASGSAFLTRFFQSIVWPLTNERGMAGAPDEPLGTDANPNDDGGWQATPTSEGLESSTDPTQPVAESQEQPLAPEGDGQPPPAEALKTEDGQPKPAEGEGAPKPSPADMAFHNSERFQEMNTRLKDLETQHQDALTKVDYMTNMAEFYQAKVNEAVNGPPSVPGPPPGQAPGQPSGQPPGQPPGQVPGQNPQVPGELPQDVVGPESWNNQTEQAGWITHTARQEAEGVAANYMQQGYEHTIVPVFNKFNESIIAMQDNLVKLMKPDYDEVTKGLDEQLFTMNPAGDVIGIKNPALVQFFRDSSIPALAKYEYALSRKAPEKIKAGVQAETKAVVDGLVNRPTSPTTPARESAANVPKDLLDWDTPTAEAEGILGKRGLIT